MNITRLLKFEMEPHSHVVYLLCIFFFTINSFFSLLERFWANIYYNLKALQQSIKIPYAGEPAKYELKSLATQASTILRLNHLLRSEAHQN